MARLMSMAVIIGVVMVAMLHYSAAQTVHVVGGNIGWTVPTGGAAVYTSWASTASFVVGDILTFDFVTNSHDVVEVSQESFDACDFSSTIGNIITTGPANISITAAGNHYYVCTIGRHCAFGQKLAISASATPGAANPPSSSTAAPPPPATTNTRPTTPSPTAEVCPPTTAPSPSMNTPTTTTSGNSPTGSQGGNDSSSSIVIASVFVSLVSLVISFFL